MTAKTTPETAEVGGGKAIAPPPLWWAVTQIGALAFHLPVSVFAAGIGAAIDPYQATLIAVAVSLCGLLVYLVLQITPVRPWQSLMITSAVLLSFWHWSASETSSVLLRVFWVALLVAAAGRFAENRRFRVAALAVAITLAALPLLSMAISAYGPGAAIAFSHDGFPGEPEVKPDIYFLLLDGYGNSDVLANIYGFDNKAFLTDLEQRGFDVALSATADYSFTHLSVPSMLNMEHLPEHLASVGFRGDPQGFRHLTEAIAGDNRLVSWLKDLGYTYIHGETYDATNDCGPNVDVCLPSPFWDYTTEYLLDRTPVGPLLFPVHGSPATSFNVMRIEQMSRWMRDWGAATVGPEFVFIHLLLPHPPYFLDGNCEIRLSSDLGGTRSDRGLSTEVVSARRAGYVEQLECSNKVVTQFIDQIDPDSMVILAGDHGPESFGQLVADVPRWSDIEIYERSGVLTAIRAPAGCQLSLPDDHHLVNTFRIALSCLTSSPMPLLPHLGTS